MRFLFVLMIMFIPISAYAGKNPDVTFSKEHSFRDIGEYNHELSILCQIGEFGQRSFLRMTAFFEKEKTLLGAAKGSGWNLIDVNNIADPKKDYWFHNQGYNCSVFETGSK